MPPKTKGESSDLIRVRNNQQRSRARRHEYVAELERKVHECNAHGLPPCTPIVVTQDMILRLEEENRKLRELLALTGVEQTLVDTHLTADSGAPEAGYSGSRPQSSPETAPEDLSAAMVPTADGARMPNSSDEMFADSFLQLPADEFGMLFEPLQTTSSFDSSSITQRFSGPFLPLPYNPPLVPPGVNLLCPVESLLPISSQSDSGTTLCSVAYELIREHNKRGIDMIEIGIRLWNGFVKGDRAGGCKVENELLFSVLEYLKG
ncbi:hypothetical protein NA56DRAFT_695808 [Hyaloscypha hepaticicola]|uniref:BZIP domain-containing protein n=1 Tax=Hyaloscypha hepaticicola TaxID=2082293 RepID=A0A2J6PD48_9HELO|nr:hypothetical protein NA56DRAFT_695808 [Hyaloscypha hepaticicola]